MAKSLAETPRISSDQKTLYKLLCDLNIEFHEEGPETQIAWYNFDCLIPKQGKMTKHLLIECQGEFFHSPPDRQRRDRGKFTYIQKYHTAYEVMYIWGREFKEIGKVLDRLKLKLGLQMETLNFEFTAISTKEITYKDANDFLKTYHYLEKGRGGKAVGAYHGDELVAVAVFSPPLRQNQAKKFGVDSFVELSRFCIHPRRHKRNFASWFLKKALKHVSGLVVAYADTTVGHYGTIYKATNFTEHHTVPADYWYAGDGGYVMHKRTLYGQAIKMHMTEAEYAKAYGYVKQYGGQKICYTYVAGPRPTRLPQRGPQPA